MKIKMKKTSLVKTKKGYVSIDTCVLDNPLANRMDRMGFGNPDAIEGEYETMVFKCNKNGEVKDWTDLAKANYSTEKEADEGHEKMIKQWGEKIKDLD